MAILHAWRFCPRCACALEPDTGRVVCPACGFVAYANSAPCACALVEDDAGRLLLGRRAIDPDRGLWDIPGGYLEEHEHPLDGLRRELREETGLEIEPLRFVGAFMDWYGDGPEVNATLNLVWTARASGEPRAADDVAELRWFAADELPPADEFAFDSLPSVLDAWRAGQTDAGA
jgi:ADP-ribose pyrophosphatase YjhB (NUDIX family)